MNIEITLAKKEEKPIIQNLARFYIYDLSEYQKRKCPDDGLYEDEDYIRYWTKPGHFAYLIKCEGELAGFAFVEEGGSLPDINHSIEEFFIVRKFRGTGVAATVARELFQKFPGRWEVKVISGNTPAKKFWETAISDYARGDFTKSSEFHDTQMEVFRFSTPD